MTGSEPLPGPAVPRSVLFTVFLVVLMDLVGFGIVLPLLPFFARSLAASPLTVGLLFSTFSVTQLLFSPLWGRISDRLGRRTVMIVSTLGSAISYFVFALAEDLPLLFLARFLSGAMAGNISAAQATIADVTEEKERAGGMGILGAAFGIGFVTGPALATAILQAEPERWAARLGAPAAAAWLASHPYAAPGLVASFIGLASFLFVLLRFPETRRARAAGPGAGAWKLLVTAPPALARLFFLTFLFAFCHAAMYSVFPLFCDAELGMTAQEVGRQYILIGIVAVVVQGMLMKGLVARFGEESLFRSGVLLLGAGYILLPFSREPLHVSICLGMTATANSLLGPPLMSRVSKEAPAERMGLTMGVAQGLSGLGRALGPAWGGWLFGFAPFLPFHLTALGLLAAVRRGRRKDL